jgi:toxin ParE1/3/4
MNVIWMPAANRDRRDITDNIAQDNPAAAIMMDELYQAASERLARFPHAGRPGKNPATRELIAHKNYRMVYQVGEDSIWTLALFHTSRQWPPDVFRMDR